MWHTSEKADIYVKPHLRLFSDGFVTATFVVGGSCEFGFGRSVDEALKQLQDNVEKRKAYLDSIFETQAKSPKPKWWNWWKQHWN